MAKATVSRRCNSGLRFRTGLRGETDPQIALALQFSPATVRKWRRRAQCEGRSGLVSHMGRPRTGALGQISLEVHGGPRPAAGESRLGAANLASRTGTIGGLPACTSQSRPPGRLSQGREADASPRAPQRVSPARAATQRLAPHDTWEMDAQGVRQLDESGPRLGDQHRRSLQPCPYGELGLPAQDEADHERLPTGLAAGDVALWPRQTFELGSRQRLL